MDTGKVIFFGLALIALAIFATDAMHPANAGAHQVGSYNISSAGPKTGLWIIDTSTGRYRRCGLPYNKKGQEYGCEPWVSIQ